MGVSRCSSFEALRPREREKVAEDRMRVYPRNPRNRGTEEPEEPNKVTNS
jgi:hypothetical protein